MTWTKIAHLDYARQGRRYSSDLTDREWSLIVSLLPSPSGTCQRL